MLAARRAQARALWSVGAPLLIGCAVKLVVLDFGSLGQLTNILTVIAAGLLFLLVSWLAPLPPKSPAKAIGAAPQASQVVKH